MDGAKKNDNGANAGVETVAYLGGLFKKILSEYKRKYYFCGIKIWSRRASPLRIVQGEIAKLQFPETIGSLERQIRQNEHNLAELQALLRKTEDNLGAALEAQADLFTRNIETLRKDTTLQNEMFTQNIEALQKSIDTQVSAVKQDMSSQLSSVRQDMSSQLSALKDEQDENKRNLVAQLTDIRQNMLDFSKATDIINQKMTMIGSKLSLLHNFVKTASAISFSDNALPLMKSGFYPAESWGCWLENRAFLLLKAMSGEQDINLDIRLNCFHPEGEKVITLYTNGKQIGSYNSNQGTNILKAKIDKYDISSGGFIALEFATVGQESPNQVSGSADTRMLGFGLIELKADTEFLILGLDNDLFRNLWQNKQKCSFNNEEWEKYFADHDVAAETKELKKNMPTESQKLIDEFVARRKAPYMFSAYEEDKHDKVLQQNVADYLIADTTGFQSEIFYFKNGLKFLDENIVKEHLGERDVIDGGACSGDSTLMFSEFDFVNKVYAFEPVKKSFDNLQKTLELNHCTKAEAVHAGLSDGDANAQIMGELCKTVSIDSFAKDKKIGCIKLDVEGMETKVINGALNTIKRDKPLLLVCLYHSPKDFFGIKKTIEKLKLGYKFMVCDTEPCNGAVGIHLMLIAYQE